MSTYVSWRMDDHLHEGDLQTLSLIQSWDWLDLRRSAGCPNRFQRGGLWRWDEVVCTSMFVLYTKNNKAAIARAKRIGA